MSPHPSIFELNLFVTRGETSAGFEQHVSACPACAARLSSFAARVASPVVVAPPADERRFQAAAIALVACLAVLMVRAVSLPLLEARPPEGVHGVAPAPQHVVFVDAGPVDSGVR